MSEARDEREASDSGPSAGSAERLSELERLALPSVRLLHRAHARREAAELLGQLAHAPPSAAREILRARAAALLERLKRVDEHTLGPLRARLEAGELSRAELDASVERLPKPDRDAFIEKLFDIEHTPTVPRKLAPNMTHYHPSPAWAALEVGRRLRPEDTFFELGSGLGKVMLVAALWSDAAVVGIELDEPLARASRERAGRLAPRVEILIGDVRSFDLSRGTDFYLYTPFEGDVLDDVLLSLEAVAWKHPVRLWTLGRVTEMVARAGWVEPDLEIETLVRFRSTLLDPEPSAPD
ncbi:MAG: class I SAM-dependent methyltransferase [Deltaproteobacteria bacterium]|nr:class I SAM-dependent methyltransferase [Deltaproteobacteria bacterium]